MRETEEMKEEEGEIKMVMMMMMMEGRESVQEGDTLFCSSFSLNRVFCVVGFGFSCA